MNNGHDLLADLGLRLRNLRRQAGLSQGEAASRMGLPGKQRRKYVERLENGCLKRLDMVRIGRFLQACGAHWYQITDILERQEPVKLDTGIAKSVWLSDAKVEKSVEAAQARAEEFQAKMAPRAGARPVHPGRKPEIARRYGSYQLSASLIEALVQDVLREADIPTGQVRLYQNAARQLLGMLWRQRKRMQNAECRMQKSKRGDGIQDSEFRAQNAKGKELMTEEIVGKLEQKEVEWRKLKMDLDLVARVQAVVVVAFQQMSD